MELKNEIAFLPAHLLVEKIKQKEIRSESLLELYIERYNQHNSKINAIVATGLDNARKRARQADEALARGEDWGPLHGLPLTIKDTFEVGGSYQDLTTIKFAQLLPEVMGGFVQPDGY